MSRGSVESSQPRPRTGAKTLKRCRNRVDRDDLVIIDVDSDGFDSVIIIDVPESLPKKHRSSRLSNEDKKGARATVICLDDDENYESNNVQSGMKVDGNLNNGASTSKSSRHVSGHVGRSLHGVDDDCEFIYVSPVKLAKGKRTYSGKGTSDSDYIDCELVEDSFCVREQWENAFWKRKSDTLNGQSGVRHPESKGHENDHVNEQDQHKENSFVGNDSETKPATDHSIPEEKYGASYNTVDDTKGNPPDANEGPQESASNNKMNLDDQLDDEDDSEGYIIGEREKLKETNEYKKALEEELASRQLALQAQAEEAQNMRRLLKREKAETMRLLDMERRQKQRVEEIRETQKKVVEYMNLKEVIRASVRKELNLLEKSCYSMASLLQGLGVLDAGSIPPVNQVRLAYKKALLTFHPDRASRSDIQQQVEAEEKFKLISRMKEKFLLPV